jgi:hypothetical protein
MAPHRGDTSTEILAECSLDHPFFVKERGKNKPDVPNRAIFPIWNGKFGSDNPGIFTGKVKCCY